jgi:hypothetical protein
MQAGGLWATALAQSCEAAVEAWNDRRRELEDLALAVAERVKVETAYAKGMEKVGRTVERNIRPQGVSSFIFSAFMSDHLHRAEQSRTLCESLKDEVQQMIQKVLD